MEISIDVGQEMNKKEALRFFLKSLDLGDNKQFTGNMDLISSLIYKKKKEIIFLESQKGKYLYFLLSGSIKLYKTNDDGREAVMHFVEPGEFFAEIILFLESRYPVSAAAIKNSEILEIDAEKIFDIVKKEPDFAIKLIGIFAQRLNHLTNIIKNLSIMDTKSKFLNYLETIKNEDNTAVLNIPKREIALLLGIKPETFSRVIKQLSYEGIISVKGKNIKLLK